MSEFKDVLIQTIEKDLLALRELGDRKILRKECSLILKRIDNAVKLLSEDIESQERLLKLDKQVMELKNSI